MSRRSSKRVSSSHSVTQSLRYGLFIVSGVVLVTVLVGSPVRAEDSESSETATVHKTSDGLHFNVPPDWPIQKRNGVTGPIPIEEYLARKFKALESRLQALEQHLSSLDIRLRVVEEETKKQRQGLRSAEQPAQSAQPAEASTVQ